MGGTMGSHRKYRKYRTTQWLLFFFLSSNDLLVHWTSNSSLEMIVTKIIDYPESCIYP